MFSEAIVRRPCRNMINGITSASLGRPDYNNALIQHDKYIEALKFCGLNVTILEADEEFPDSTFIEDTALITPKCAIITNSDEPSRRGETEKIREFLGTKFNHIEEIKNPGIIEAGDIMMVGSHYYIGLSGRTNISGAQQISEILENYGMSASTVKLEKVLHLKTGLSYLERNNLIVSGEFIDHPSFMQFDRILISDAESYSANCIWINDKVIIPAGFPDSAKAITSKGYTTIEVDVSEFRKLDGGLSCLSLRF